MQVAFLGLGIMGSRMARHIVDGGHQLTVWNRSPEAAEAFRDTTATIAASPAEAAKEADVLITMLASPDVVQAVMLDGGALDAMSPGSIWADASTVNPAFARQSAEWAMQRDLRYLGAPVAGTREPAAEGTLRILLGGDAATLEEVRSVLETYSSSILHVGSEPDRGAALKILINGMLAQSLLVFSEALHLGKAMGMDQELLLRVLPQLPVIAPAVSGKAEEMRKGAYDDVSFPLELMQKDLNLIVQTAYECNQPALLAAVAREMYGRARSAGLGRSDYAAVHSILG